MESSYFDLDRNRDGVSKGLHRQLIGDQWDAIGRLQFEFLVSEGLKPEHKLVDIGCGSLRGGVHFVNYLEPGNYHGSDMNQAFLDAGYDIELAEAGIQDRMPRENLVCTDAFELPWPDGTFDFAIAQSVFTHLTLNRIRQCLVRTAPKMKPGGTFYATFFELPDGAPSDRPLRHEPGGKITYDVQDPYHYSVRDLSYAIRGLPWHLRYIGDWNHPRAQRICAFVRAEDAPAPEGEDQRSLTIDEAGALDAGRNHYRAYVGPPNRFDFMSATQFGLLFQNGLRDHHHVLDFGAGSLRLGRLLIPYLRPGRYHAIEPNTWLIDDAVRNELGQDAVDLKQPVFSADASFNCAVLGRKFDFIMAQSIVTHCGPALFQKLMNSFADVLEEDGLALFSYWNTPEPHEHAASEGWVYPGSVRYTEAEVHAFLSAAGLSGKAIPWYHPGASWFLASRNPGRLPNDDELRFLSGAVLHDPQFAASRRP
ncbi:methyltransferase [Sphingomonas sp. RS6]